MPAAKISSILAISAFFAACAPPQPNVGQDRANAPASSSASAAASFTTPASLKGEHQEIHAVLEKAATEPGDLGTAARELRDLLDPHFRREEEIATPPLGLLVPLSQGPVTPEMRAVLPMTEALERELPGMLADHIKIGAARERFEAAARLANREDYLAFSEALAHHARQEEEILYPAAVLVGRFVAVGSAGR